MVQYTEPPLHHRESHGTVALESHTGPVATASPNAFGRSGAVRVLFALPGAPVSYPLEVHVPPAELAYTWVSVEDTIDDPSRIPQPAFRLTGGRLPAPPVPGFYRLVFFAAGSRYVVDGPTLAVLVPFAAKVGSSLNGYRIGSYLTERLGGGKRPEGFVEIRPELMELPLTRHLRLADFVTHDGQEIWPRYAALDARLLDKIELVVTAIRRRHGDRVRFELDVHSGFRTPSHNRRVGLAARDSRHQYGDAADVSIDADGDGRISAADIRIVAEAVDEVERDHPDLAGGMGLYNRGGGSYVHIDARGQRARWRG